MSIIEQPSLPTSDVLEPPRKRSPKNLLLCALSGLLLIGAFPALDWGWLAWAALVPFLLTFPHQRMRDALAGGFVMGLVFFAGLWYWMVLFAAHVIGKPLALVVWLGAALTQSVSVVLFAAGTQGLSQKRSPWAWRLGVPALWALIEWGRQFGTFGTSWGDLAYTQHAALIILQSAKVVGVFGLSFLIVLVNVTLGLLWASRKTQKRDRFALAVAGVMGAALVYGIVTIQTEHLHPVFPAAALQADVDENVAWTPEYAQQTINAFGKQAQAAAAQGAKLVVWPETAFPGFLLQDAALRSEVSAMAVQDQEDMLIGGVDYDYAAQKNANALFLMKSNGLLAGSYWKQKLVPFGEYIPYRKQFPFLDKLHLSIFDMQPGGAHQAVLDAGAPVGRIGTAICYDSTDNEILRRQVALGADLLVVSTDDTWFGHTAAARQHAAFAAVRAAEDDRYLVRCAATGVSQVIAPTGRVIAEADLFQPKVVIARVQPRHDLTLYVRWGDWFVSVCALLLLVFLPDWGSLRGNIWYNKKDITESTC